MKMMTIQVPDDSVDFVEEFVERIGGSVEVKSEEKKQYKKAQVKKTATKKNKKEEIDHTFLFGKWKDYDIDARKLRAEAWQRNFG